MPRPRSQSLYSRKVPAPHIIGCVDKDCEGLMKLIPYTDPVAYHQAAFEDYAFITGGVAGGELLSHYRCTLCAGVHTVRKR